MWRAKATSVGCLTRLQPGRPTRHAVAMLVVGAALILIESLLSSLDHGTHLLMGLALVGGTAVFVGAGPGMSGLVAGGGASIIASAPGPGPLAAPASWVPLGMYLVVGVALLSLTRLGSRALRSSFPIAATVDPPPDVIEPLTGRELEILRLAATGIAVVDIGDRLFLSPNTVKTHLTHVYAKLGVRGRCDAIRIGLHHGYLTPADICPHRYGGR